MPTKKVEAVEETATELMPMPTDFPIEIGSGVHVARKIRLLRDKIKEVKPQKMEQGRLKYNYLGERDMTLTIRPVMQEPRYGIL